MNKDSFLYTVIFTFLVAFAFVFFLAMANDFTLVRVEANLRLAEYKALLGAAGIATTDATAEADFTEAFPGATLAEADLLRTRVDGQDILVKKFTGAGLWGSISGVIATDDAVQTIRGLEIIAHSETPGLGGRIEESWFLDQFKGENVAGGLTVTKVGVVDTDSANGAIDGVTGASLTSKAMETIVNDELNALKEAAR